MIRNVHSILPSGVDTTPDDAPIFYGGCELYEPINIHVSAHRYSHATDRELHWLHCPSLKEAYRYLPTMAEGGGSEKKKIRQGGFRTMPFILGVLRNCCFPLSFLPKFLVFAI